MLGPSAYSAPAGVPTRPPGFLDEQGPGGGIPRRQAEFPKAVDAAGRHIGEIERGGARPAHAGRGGHDHLEHGEIVIDVRRAMR